MEIIKPNKRNARHPSTRSLHLTLRTITYYPQGLCIVRDSGIIEQKTLKLKLSRQQLANLQMHHPHDQFQTFPLKTGLLRPRVVPPVVTSEMPPLTPPVPFFKSFPNAWST